MVLKLHGDARSTCTKRVAQILLEKQVPFTLVPALAGAKSAEYKAKMQPFGQIPVLEDGGYVLFESRAMGRYIARKYAGQGTPGLIVGEDAGMEELGIFEQAMAIEATQFLAAEQLVHEVLIKPHMGWTTDAAEVARLTALLAAKMDAYEQILGKTKYLAGDHITLADLYHLPYAELITNRMGSDVMTARPNVARWFREISARPSWVAVKDGVSSRA
ncbi:glutathione S-transferase [Mycena vulgaris]|nr:glutathione S-transferase [Mycena vulgaris]